MLSLDSKARNLFTERSNLVLLCRFTVKTIIDKASVRCIEEDSADVVNLIAAIEQILSHGIRKVRSWLSDGQGCYYDFVTAACRAVPNHCLCTVEAMGFLKDGLSKGRAWLKLALMEKRLTVYLSAALQQHSLARNFYHDHAILLSEDMNVLMQDLLGLSALDFSFFLKDDATSPTEPMIVDLAPYLRFHQCAESVLSDIQEARRSAPAADPVCSSCGVAAAAIAVDSEERLNALQKQHKQICEQKAYLEEVCRQKGRQLDDCQLRIKQLCQRMSQDAAAWASERRHLERLVARMHLDMQKINEQLQGQHPGVGLIACKEQQQQHMEEEMRHTRLAAAELALDNRSDISISTSDTTTFSDGFSIKDDNQSLMPLIGSLCSLSYAATATEHGSNVALDSDDDVARSHTFVRNAQTSPTNKAVRTAVSGYGSEALHSPVETESEPYRLVQPGQAERKVADSSLAELDESRCICDSAAADRTDNRHSVRADVGCSSTSDESSNISAAVLSLLDKGPPSMAHCIAFVSSNESDTSVHSNAATAADTHLSYTASQSLSLLSGAGPDPNHR